MKSRAVTGTRLAQVEAMAGRKHETLVDMFRRRPTLVLDLLRAIGVSPPRHSGLSVDPADLPQILPVSYHADLVISLRAPSGRVVLRIILEVQRRIDRRKELS
jgi:hypothetical protein